MIQELKSLKIELLVSIWPQVDKISENYQDMLENGLLVRQDRGLRTSMDFQGDTVHADFTNPSTRRYVWDLVKKNYYDKGVRVFWLDEAEPEYNVYDFDIYRYYNGSALTAGNVYPVEYAKAFYEGMRQEGQKDICSLIRCAWAGSQKYGTLLWSGDIATSWKSFKCQLAAGLNVGMAGIPWWTTDIGKRARLCNLRHLSNRLPQAGFTVETPQIPGSESFVHGGFNSVRREMPSYTL